MEPATESTEAVEETPSETPESEGSNKKKDRSRGAEDDQGEDLSTPKEDLGAANDEVVPEPGPGEQPQPGNSQADPGPSEPTETPTTEQPQGTEPSIPEEAVASSEATSTAACPAELEFGRTYECTVASAGQRATFTLPATGPGDLVRLRAVTTAGPLQPSVEVLDPEGNPRCGSASETDCNLGMAGVHTVVVADRFGGSSTGDYNLHVQLLTDPRGCGAVPSTAFGAEPLQGAIATAAEEDCFFIDLQAGEQLRLSVADATPEATDLFRVELVDPDGFGRCGRSNRIDCRAEEAGAHLAIVSGASPADTGDYELRVGRVNDPQGCLPVASLAFGTDPVVGRIDAPQESDCYTLPATRFDVVRVRAVTTSGALQPSIEVFDPDGNARCGNFSQTDCNLDVPGAHTVVISDRFGGSNTGDYSLHVQLLTDPAGCSPLSSTAFDAGPIDGSISAAAEQDCFLVDLQAGDRIRLQASDATPAGADNFEVEVISLGGLSQCGSSRELRCQADESGSYPVIVGGNSPADIGDYELRVQRLNDAQACLPITSLAFGTDPARATITRAHEADCFTLPPSKFGDVVRVRAVNTSGPLQPSIEVFDPDGDVRCGASFSAEVDCSLGADGSHTVVVADRFAGSNTGDYALHVQLLTDPTGCGAVPSTAFDADSLDGSITPAAEEDCFLVDLSSGDRVRLEVADAAPAAADFFDVELVRPEGFAVCGSTTEVDCQAGESGTYAVIVSGGSRADTGDYELRVARLNEPQGCSPIASLAFGTNPASGAIDPANEADCFTLPSTRFADVVRVRVVTTSGPLQPSVEIFDPNGDVRCGTSFSGEADCRLDLAGPHTVVVSDRFGGSNTGDYSLHLQLLTQPKGCASVTSAAFDASPIEGSIAASAEQDCFLIDLDAGDRLRSRVNDADLAGDDDFFEAELVSPDGFAQCRRSIQVDCQANEAGTYVVVVGGISRTSTGKYELRAERLNDPQGCVPVATLAFGSDPARGVIDEKHEAHCFTLPAARFADVLRVRAVTTSGPLEPSVEVFDALGDSRCGSAFSGETDCILGSAGAHTVVLMDRFQGANTGDYSLHVQSLTAPEGCAALILGPTDQEISPAGETDCFVMSLAAGDQIQVTASDTTGSRSPGVEILDESGNRRCGPSTGPVTCEAPFDGDLVVLAQQFFDRALTGPYRLDAVCLTPPCGPDRFGLASISPDRGGDGGPTTATIVGKGFEDGVGVRLVGPEQPDILGEEPVVADDGRSITVTFELQGQPLGARDLVVSNSDGGEASLPRAFTVETSTPPDIRVDIAGREAIRRGVPQDYTVTLTNEGNNDAGVTPVWIAGLPIDAEIDPGFPLLPPPGTASDPGRIDYSKVPITYEVDGEGYLPLLLPRIPAGNPVSLKFSLKTSATDTFALRAWANPCRERVFAAQTSKADVVSASSAADSLTECENELNEATIEALVTVAGESADLVIPGSSCVVSAGAHLGRLLGGLDDYLSSALDGGTSVNGVSYTQYLYSGALIGAECLLDQGLEAVPVVGQIKALGEVLHSGYQLANAANRDCSFAATRDSVSNRSIQPVASFDPNDKLGPAGAGEERYLSGDSTFRYTVFFENVASATAAAQVVRIEDELDVTSLDLTTFSLGPIAFGARRVVPPPGLSSYEAEVDLRPENNLRVRINAALDAAAGKVVWEFASIDPETGEPTDDPLAGFLPPNVNPPEGDGSVMFDVAPLSQLASGDSIENSALIFFDVNEPIATPVWRNTIDKTAPMSSVAGLAAVTGTEDLAVSWNGTDGDSGVHDYRIFVSENGGVPELWLADTTETSAIYPGENGNSYGFFSVARDRAGNFETTPDGPDTSTTVDAANLTPDASFDSDVSSGPAPLVVAFDASESADEDGEIVSYAWDFGDGSTAQGAGVTHTYSNPGGYTVTLTVTDDKGLTGTATRSISVTGGSNAPVAVDDAATVDTANRSPSVTVDVSVNDVDSDGDLDRSSVALEPGRFPGRATANGDGTLSYSPPIGFTGTVVLNYQICDLQGQCDLAALSIDAQLSGCTITGTAGRDVLTGTQEPDVVCGLGGHDVLKGRGGDDLLVGGEGNDMLDAGAGADILIGGSGDDFLAGGSGDDVLIGGSGRNVLSGGSGSDGCRQARSRRGCESKAAAL